MLKSHTEYREEENSMREADSHRGAGRRNLSKKDRKIARPRF
jgi:hypothetical protein